MGIVYRTYPIISIVFNEIIELDFLKRIFNSNEANGRVARLINNFGQPDEAV